MINTLIMLFTTSPLPMVLAVLTLSTTLLAAPTPTPIPYVEKVNLSNGGVAYVCVDSDLSCITKRVVGDALEAVKGFVGKEIVGVEGTV